MPNVLIITSPYLVPDAVPYGPAVVSGILNNSGYQARTWDLNIDMYEHFHSHPDWELFTKNLCIGWTGQLSTIQDFTHEVLDWTRQQLEQQINEHRPDVVAVSVFSSQSADYAVPLLTLVRELAPDAYVIVGGRGLDNLEKRTGEDYATFYTNRMPIDCAYVGDAENQLIDCIDRRVCGIYIADPVSAEDLENVPKADWTGYDMTKYLGYSEAELRLPITTSKGCVRKCTFCDVFNSWPKFIFRRGADVADELIDTYQRTGVKRFEFTDNLINGSVSNFREMNARIAEQLPNTLDYQGLAICRGRKESPRTDFELARAAGASLFKVGIESGSQQVRYDMKKKFTNDDIDWFSENCADVGIVQQWLLFVGYPTETDADFQQTLDLIRRYRTLLETGQIRIWLSLPMMITSGGGFLQRHAREYGLEHIMNDPWKEHFWTSTKYTENTFDVRARRWRQLIDLIAEINPANLEGRQTEKMMELDGLEKIYEDYRATNGKTIIPIIRADIEQF